MPTNTVSDDALKFEVLVLNLIILNVGPVISRRFPLNGACIIVDIQDTKAKGNRRFGCKRGEAKKRATDRTIFLPLSHSRHEDVILSLWTKAIN
jgi:hypothetical protein